MSDKRERDRRRERQPAFDDQPDYFSGSAPRVPAAAAPQSEPVVDAVVKRFNPERGFGFVTLSDGSPDAFIHISRLEGSGQNLAPGKRLRVRVGSSPRGAEVTEVLSIEPDQFVRGVVKWFRVDKGFGFINPDDGGREIFVSLQVVQFAGLDTLSEGQRVEVTILQVAKGPAATSIKVID
jgi:CspA family cold shock protein